MLAPPRNKPADRVGVQESSRRRRDLAGSGLAGRARQVLQGPAQVSVGAGRQQLASQCIRGAVARAEQQFQGGARVVTRG
jgi:hypothetical protein